MVCSPVSMQPWKQSKSPMIDYGKRKANYIITTRDMSPESREFMATEARYAYEYAMFLLRNRFEEGEDVIATDGCYSCLYAIDVLQARFEKGEQAIFNGHCDSDLELIYRERFLKKTNPPQFGFLRKWIASRYNELIRGN